MTQPASGWYPDPSGQPGERWWNGSAWSQETRTAPTAAPAAPEHQAWDGFGQPAAPGSTPPPYGGPTHGNAPAHGSAPTPTYGSDQGGAPPYGSAPAYGQNPSYGQPPTYGGTPPYGSDQRFASTPPPYAGGPDGSYGAPAGAGRGAGAGTFLARNGYSLATLGVAVGYVLVLFFAHIAVLGILPLVLGVSAVRRREPLAWGAVVLGVLALGFGIYLYTR